MALLMTATLAVYFLLLIAVAMRSKGRTGNEMFFRAGRQSPWWMVSFGMIGSSISGVSFISVPGWVESTGMTYAQMCAGFFWGYLAVAFILLPLYYRLRLTSIYSWLGNRFGRRTHRTGAAFFLLSKLTGAAARLYLASLVIQEFLLPSTTGNTPYSLAVYMALCTTILGFIYAYTRRHGIFTIIRTDIIQTFCLLTSLVMMLIIVVSRLHLDLSGAVSTIISSPMSQVFEWEWDSPQCFWRQFLSGIFIVIVMTGLDQDMMQKNLTCRTLREAQKNMCAYGACFLPLNLLLLGLGVLLHALCSNQGITPPAEGDALLPSLVASGSLGTLITVPFTIGVVAAAFSSADSALTSLTTSCCIDVLRIEDRGLTAERQTTVRRRVHIAVCAAFLLCLLLFRLCNDTSVINAIYIMASYTYGPLLGLYAFGLATHHPVQDRLVPYICITAPVLCIIADWYAARYWGYTFGYELLMTNGGLTFMGLWIVAKCSHSSRLQHCR